MSIVLISREISTGSPERGLQMLRFHGEYTTHIPEGLVRIGEDVPHIFFPDGGRHWVVTEPVKNVIERELNGVGFEPAYCNRLIHDPGDQHLAVARERHLRLQPQHGILDYFLDEDALHTEHAPLFWMYLPLFGTGVFLPEVTQQIVDQKREAIFLEERAYIAYVSPFLTPQLIAEKPLFMIHSSLAMANWLFDSLEPYIDKLNYQVTTLHGA
jgi:hypothetical protein